MESDRTVPAVTARRVVAIQAVLSVAVVAAILAVPLPSTGLRILVGVLIIAMSVVQYRTFWLWRRQDRLAPRLLRWADLTLWFWGAFTGLMFVWDGDSSLRAVLGNLVAGAMFGVIMWFIDRQPQDRVREQV